mgnify:CR=1 FL=1
MDRASRFLWEMSCGRKDRKLFRKAIKTLKRVIQKHITNVMSEKILAGDFTEGDVVQVGLDSHGLIAFAKEERA